MSDNARRISRNTWEKLNGYPSRFGTARRNPLTGRLLPGEYNGRGLPIGSRSEGPSRGLSPAHDWSGFDSAFENKPDGTPRTPVAEGDEETGGWNYSDIAGTSAANASLAAVGLPPAVAPSSAPQIGSQAVNSRGGGVNVSRGVSNPPAPNNLRPGQAATASLADRRVVRMKPFTPITSPEGSRRTDRANFDRSLDIAKNPLDRPREASWWDTASKDSDGIQALLDDGARSNPDRIASQKAADAIAANGGREGSGLTPYGPVAVSKPQRFGPNPMFGPEAPAASTGVAGPKGPPGASAIPSEPADLSAEWFGPTPSGRPLAGDIGDKKATADSAAAAQQKQQEQYAANAKKAQEGDEQRQAEIRRGMNPDDRFPSDGGCGWGN